MVRLRGMGIYGTEDGIRTGNCSNGRGNCDMAVSFRDYFFL